MQPFEERLTAWIDDRLPAEEHAAFERELAAHPDAPSFHSEKRHVSQLRSLLRDHLQAPPLTSPDFFNHGILERIAAETRREQEAAPARQVGTWERFQAFFGSGSLTPARLLVAGAACLITATVGIYALIPSNSADQGGIAKAPPALQTPATPQPVEVAVESTPAPDPAVPGPRSRDDGQFALNNRPAPDSLSPAPSTQHPATEVAPTTTAAPPAATSATLLHFDEQNADVLWLDGLDYLPEVNAGTPSPGVNTPPAQP